MADAIYRLQCSMACDSMFPRDRMVITPVFRIQTFVLGTSDPQKLCDDLAAALNTWCVGGAGELTVKAYDCEKPKPNPPAGSKTINTGTFKTSPGPRELACCLSFYADQNIPRRRGRVYVPWPWIWESGSTPLRPSAPIRARVTSLASVFKNLGGANVDWGLWSERTGEFHTATHQYVDDEWDVQRRRGLRSTTRDLSTTGE